MTIQMRVPAGGASITPMPRALARLKPASTVFLLCDVQEKFRKAIHKFATVVSGAQRMIRVADELSIPVIVTEQYPKGLGKQTADRTLRPFGLRIQLALPSTAVQ